MQCVRPPHTRPQDNRAIQFKIIFVQFCWTYLCKYQIVFVQIANMMICFPAMCRIGPLLHAHSITEPLMCPSQHYTSPHNILLFFCISSHFITSYRYITLHRVPPRGIPYRKEHSVVLHSTQHNYFVLDCINEFQNNYRTKFWTHCFYVKHE